jgi:hypothetical protein
VAESETFLGRWSRRKAEARREPEGPPLEQAGRQDTEQTISARPETLPDTPPDQETKQRWIAELEKVDIEKLTSQDDFSVFMKEWVPQALRQKALRKLWTADPVLGVNDGLDDWCGDYTNAATVVADLKSSWLPGKGYSWLDDLASEAEKLTAGSAVPAPAGENGDASSTESAEGEDGEEAAHGTEQDGTAGPDGTEGKEEDGSDVEQALQLGAHGRNDRP